MQKAEAQEFFKEIQFHNNENQGAKNGKGGTSSARPAKMKTLAQVRAHQIPKLKEELKLKLPTLTPVDIRRFYLAHYEAVLIELEEDGYSDVARFFENLFELDEEIRRRAGPGTAIWKKPRLKNRPNLIDRLRDGLIAAEDAKRASDGASEAMALLETALFFERQTWEWWWIAERLYKRAFMASEAIIHRSEDLYTVTLVRYLYGRFLFHKLEDHYQSIEHLNAAREASEGKTWSASKVLQEEEQVNKQEEGQEEKPKRKYGRKHETIFRESCILLYKALLVVARQTYSEDVNLAIEACEEAVKRATDTGDNAYVIEALYELGRSCLRANDIKNALQNFSKLLAMAKRIPDPEGMCNAHMELAFAYKELEDHESTRKHLNLFKDTATEFGLMRKLAQAHYYIGEHFLTEMDPDSATMHLETAFYIYGSLEMIEDADRARIIAGISKGQEVIDRYLDLILQCRRKDSDAILKLCKWKNNRENFSSKQSDDVTSDSIEEMENFGYEKFIVD